MDLNKPEPNVECLTRFQSLEAGHYWRALQEIPEEGISEGLVLLIESIRWVDNAAHTIILRPHPLMIGKEFELEVPDGEGGTRTRWGRFTEHRFLLKDFLAKFEFEPDFKQIRTAELAKVQGRIEELQRELVQTQSTPALMAKVVEEGLQELAEKDPKARPALGEGAPEAAGLVTLATGTLAGALNAGVTPETVERMKVVANREHQVAEVKANWITGMTTQIAETVKAMTPFYEEQAAAALAQTEEVRTYVTKLMQGIESLDLYTGKNVHVTTLREGPPAPPDVPLTFVQAKLLMDEELAVWAEVDKWFDFSKESLFHEALAQHDGLVSQIFPTERCVLVMATTRRYIDYGGNPLANMVLNQENAKVFLLVRNGMNIYKVLSPVESHLGTKRLFPTADDQERIFRGLDGTQITFQDVAYTDRLAQHDSFALHYKRFLLLVCGLDHRVKLFGDFYPGPASFDFLSMSFQDQYCRFLHDDDASRRLGGDAHLPVKEWIAAKNAYLRPGSRVLCSWFQIMDAETAPSACREDYRNCRTEFRYRPKAELGIAIAFKDGPSVCVEVEVCGETRAWRDRTFKCKVTIPHFKDTCGDDGLGLLCLDAVTPEDLRWYISNRQNRVDHLSYIRFFKQALKFIETERVEEADTRARLQSALEEGNVGAPEEREGLVDQAVIAWRAAQRGRPLPKFEDGKASKDWKSLLDQLYMLAGEGKRRVDEIQAFLGARGLAPLRLVLSGDAKLVVYATPTEEERDDRLQPHNWVHRITLETTKGGYVEKSRRWAILPARMAAETTLHQWDGAKAWEGLQSAFSTFEAKQEAMARVEGFLAALEPFSQPGNEAHYERLFAEWYAQREKDLEGSNTVKNPFLAIPIGLVIRRWEGLRFLCVGSTRPHVMLHRLAPDPGKAEYVMRKFIGAYKNSGYARTMFQEALDEPTDWTLLEVPVSAFARARGPIISDDVSWKMAGRRNVCSTLHQNLAAWQQEVDKEKRPFWLAPTLMEGQGALLDKVLGIQMGDSQPYRVWTITLSRGETEPGYNAWFDILEGEHAEEGETDLLQATIPNSKNCGRGSSMTVKHSIQAARAHINRTELPAGFKLVPATDLPGAPQPPEGVERWYMVEA